MVYGDLKNVKNVAINPIAGKIAVIIREKEGVTTIHRYTADKNKLNDIIVINMLTNEVTNITYKNYISDNWYVTKYTDTILDIPENLELTEDNYKEPNAISWRQLY